MEKASVVVVAAAAEAASGVNNKLTRQDCIGSDRTSGNLVNGGMFPASATMNHRRASSGANSLASNVTIINNTNDTNNLGGNRGKNLMASPMDELQESLSRFTYPNNNNRGFNGQVGLIVGGVASSGSGGNVDADNRGVGTLNEPLLGGFALLRAIQLLNIDIYYIGLGSRSSEAAKLNRLGDVEAAARVQQLAVGGDTNESGNMQPKYYRTFLDELAEYNPFQNYIDRYHLLDSLCKFLKICLSLVAIMIGFDKLISTILLCLSTRIQFNSGQSAAQVNTNSSMGLFVLILINLSSMYILYSTVFNGHLLWNLLSQRLFLVSKRFQYKTILCLLIFIYLEYLINISFINNLYEWDFTSNNIQSGSYSVLANLRVLATEQDEEHYYVDILLTIVQFARGIIRISPYIVINYSIICLKEHIHTIRNQQLLTDSLKKRQKLRLSVKSRKLTDNMNNNNQQQNQVVAGSSKDENANGANRKKRVIFMTDSLKGNRQQQQQQGIVTPTPSATNSGDIEGSQPHIRYGGGGGRMMAASSTNSIVSASKSISSLELDSSKLSSLITADYDMTIKTNSNGLSNPSSSPVAETEMKRYFLAKIRDFDELESYITNLYIFTGRLNRLMSQQGLTVFFIVHNLVISTSVIMPETVRGGIVMAYIIRLLVIIIGITPFWFGQSMNQQLEQLSRQIDRIIIQQQFIHRRRDNLVRIRELVHEIRVNCGGMLNFNVETGIKYLLLAFASAFFIEQEHYKLTRRH